MAIAGRGSAEHLSGELFRAVAGVDIVHAPYKGGAPMMTDLIAGHIQTHLPAPRDHSAG